MNHRIYHYKNVSSTLARKNLHLYPSAFYLLILASGIGFLPLCPVFASAKNYTVEEVVEGLLAAQAKLTDLRLTYTMTTKICENDLVKYVRTVEANYAHKIHEGKKENLRYLDLKVSGFDPNTKQTELQEDFLSSFNGESTIILKRNMGSNKPMRAYVFSGYVRKGFPSYLLDPHTQIWCHARKLLGNIIKENKNTFQIESESDIINGLPTVKLVGKSGSKEITMKLWVCPERNFLPLKRQFIHSRYGMLNEFALYDLVQLTNGIWYPKMIRCPDDPPGAPKPRLVSIWEISKISIDPIPNGFFTPEFPPNTRVFDDVNDVSYTTY